MRKIYILYILYIFLLYSISCFGNQTIIFNENEIYLGGDGGINKCNFEEVQGKTRYWRPRSFPIRVVINKDISNQRRQIILRAINTWNVSYQQFLTDHISDYESKKYPYKLLEYHSGDLRTLLPYWFWYVFPHSAPILILERIFSVPYKNWITVQEIDDPLIMDNKLSNGVTAVISDMSNYIIAAKITMAYKLIDPDQWYDGQLEDFQSTDYFTMILHQLGHAIGLAHDLKTETLMHKQLKPGDRFLPKAREINYIFCQYQKYWNQKTSYSRATIEP